jgi:RNA polymerase sigma-70 factor (ECF subfamily)
MEFDIASPHPAEEYERLDQIRRVQTSLNRLDRLDRRILSLTLLEGLKPGEIASRLQMSVDVVRQRKCRALRELAEMLGSSRRPVR